MSDKSVPEGEVTKNNPDWTEEILGVDLSPYAQLPLPVEPAVAVDKLTKPCTQDPNEWLAEGVNGAGTLLVIDGHSLAFRAFYAMRPDNFLATDRTQHTNAVYGFLSIMLSLLRKYQPTKLAVAFDVSRQSFRTKLYSAYKDGRRATPEEFRGQIDLIKECLEKMGIPIYSQEGYEADDYLASISKQGSAAGYRVLVCSGDRDTYQLINPLVTVLYPGRGGSDMTWMDAAAVYEKYGVTPEYYPEIAALSGEGADNLPGVPGVGEKIAVKLLKTYGNLTELLKRRDEIGGKRGQLLRENVENVVRNRYLNRLKTDLPLQPGIEEITFTPVDLEGIRGLLDYLGIGNTLRKRIDETEQFNFGNEGILGNPVAGKNSRSEQKQVGRSATDDRGNGEEKNTQPAAGEKTKLTRETPATGSADSEETELMGGTPAAEKTPVGRPKPPVLPEPELLRLEDPEGGDGTLLDWDCLTSGSGNTPVAGPDSPTGGENTPPSAAELLNRRPATADLAAWLSQTAAAAASHSGVPATVPDGHLATDFLNRVGLWVGLYDRYGKDKELVTSQSPAELLAISWGGQVGLVCLNELSDTGKQCVQDFLNRTQFLTYNWKTAKHGLAGHGIDLPVALVDLQLAGYLLDASLAAELETMTGHYLGLVFPKIQKDTKKFLKEREELAAKGVVPPPLWEEQQHRRAARFAHSLPALAATIWTELAQTGALRLLQDLENPIQQLLYGMEKTGIAISAETLRDLEAGFNHVTAHAEAEAQKIAQQPDLNLASPYQLQEVLFDRLQMPKTKKTKRGYTTNSEALEFLWEQTAHPFLEHLLAYRDSVKLLQIVKGIEKAVQPDQRVHTTFQQAVAATGRLSSIEPNLQNIPARTEVGQQIRAAFVNGEGFENLMSIDYSQIEMRIMAHLSGDEALVGAIRGGEDLHRSMAALVFGVSPDQVTPAQRSQVKATSYGLAYGLSSFGLSQQLKIDNYEAKYLMERYFSRFGKVKAYLDRVVEQARQRGYTETMYGRRRYLPDLQSSNHLARTAAERAALNAPIQGSAADLMKMAMIRVADALQSHRLRSRMLLQIHDELILEIAPGEQDILTELVSAAMVGAAELTVPLAVEIGVGKNWRAAGH